MSTQYVKYPSNGASFTAGNLTDAGTDGIVIGNGTGAVNGSGTTIAQHVADATHNGYLSSADWVTFNSKQGALTIGNLTDVGTDGITVTGGTGAVIGSGTSISQHVADTTHSGYLSSTDWNTFNGKQAPGNYITALTGDVTASGPGSVAATIAANAVTNAKSAQMTTLTIKGNNTGGTADPLDLSVAQVKTMLSLAGTNSGDVTLTAVGSSPNANGASLSTQALNLQPADGSNPGVLTAGAQTIGGAKTFSGAHVVNSTVTVNGDGSNAGFSVSAANLVTIGAASSTSSHVLRGALAQSTFQTSNNPSNGATVTTTTGVPGLTINGGGTIAGLTIKLPPTPGSGQTFWVGSSKTVTTVTWQDSGGTAGNVLGGKTSIGTAGGQTFVFDGGGGVWMAISG